MICQHNRLIALDNFTGIEVNIENSLSKVCGMFTYKKYKCEECERIITVLNAVVEEIDNV